jgi:hypothetical protein
MGPGLFQDIGAARGNGDLGSGFGELKCHGAPKPPAAAGDQGDPSIHANIHNVSSRFIGRSSVKPYHGPHFFWKKSRYPRISHGSFDPFWE